MVRQGLPRSAHAAVGAGRYRVGDVARAGGVPVPAVHHTLDGELVAVLTSKSAVSLWDYIDDAVTAEGELRGARWAAVGTVVGRLHRCLAEHPAASPDQPTRHPVARPPAGPHPLRLAHRPVPGPGGAERFRDVGLASPAAPTITAAGDRLHPGGPACAHHADRARRPRLAQPPTSRRPGCRGDRLPTATTSIRVMGDRPHRLRPANGDAQRRVEKLGSRSCSPATGPRTPPSALMTSPARWLSAAPTPCLRAIRWPSRSTTPATSSPHFRPTPGRVTAPPCACSPNSTPPRNSAASSGPTRSDEPVSDSVGNAHENVALQLTLGCGQSATWRS